MLKLEIVFFLLNIVIWALPNNNVIYKTPKYPNETSINKDKPVPFLSNVPIKTMEEKIINIPVIYISDFEGRFINIDKTQKNSYYNLLGKIKYYQNILPLINKWETPITLNNGASFWPSISIKFLLQQPKGIDFVYSLLNENHFNIINIGKKDFYTPYNIMKKLSKNKNILRLPFLSSNMNCSNAQDLPICKLTQDRKYKILKINNVKIGIISIVSPTVIKKAFYKSIKNMNILSEVKETNKLAKYLKEKKGVDLVILLAQIEDRETSPKKTMNLSEKLKNIDLIISNAENTRLIRRYNNDIYIIGTNPDRYTPNLLLLKIKKINNKFQIENIENLNKKFKYKAKVSIIFKKILDNYKKEYFKKYDLPINNMKIKALSFKVFYNFILKLMIMKTNSEIAIINEANFNNKSFPINRLTYDTIERSITYNNKIASFKMKGKLLKKFLKKNNDKLLFANINFGKNIKINGRNIIDKKKYKIATTEFIVNGGDGFLKDEFFIKKKKYYDKIKDIFKNYLKKEKFKKKNSSFDPNTEFEDLSKRFLWEFYSNLGIYYIKNDISNDSIYNKPNFDTTPTELLKLDSNINLIGSSKYHIIENRFELHYYQSNENNTKFTESNDTISYAFNYKSNYFKMNNQNNILIPLPFLESKLNSELTKPKIEKKHYFELFFSTGVSFLSSDNKFEFKLGLQGSKDFRKDDDILLGSIIGYNLNNYEVKNLDIPIKITSKFDYFLGFNQTNIVNFLLNINIPILGFFHFSTKIDSYAYKEKEKDWSYSYNLFFGINMIYNNWF